MADTLEVFREARSFTGSLMDLHPLKLDRWHRGLVGLPDALYMQLGCPALYEQVGAALKGVKAMVDMLGEDNLPVDPQEIARRQIREFSWHLALASRDTGTVCASLTWNQKETTWELTCDAKPGTRKIVSSFNKGVEVAWDWAINLQSETIREKSEASEEG